MKHWIQLLTMRQLCIERATSLTHVDGSYNVLCNRAVGGLHWRYLVGSVYECVKCEGCEGVEEGGDQ